MRVLGALIVLAALLLWLLWPPGGGGAPDPVGPLASARTEATPATGEPLLEPGARGAVGAENGFEPVNDTGPERVAAATPPGRPASDDGIERHALVLSLVDPARGRLEVADVRAVLAGADGEPVATAASSGPTRALTVQVPLGVYELSVSAAGFTHLPARLDLSDPRRREAVEGHARHAFVERVVLWPEGWIPVAVRTRDGRSFATLATDRELEPKRFFVGAFDVHASHDRGLGEGGSDPGEVLAVFHRAPGDQIVEISDAIAGSLRILKPRPFWVGLWVHGTLHERRLLGPADTALVFELDMEALDARLARVSLRLVDRDSGAPVPDGARATLKAETSSHRRHDLQDVGPDAGGGIAFARVVPGLHELTITRSSNLVQRALQLYPGQELELGDVPIGLDPAVILRVVDVHGAPVESVVEIAPYVRGGAVSDLYHPNLHRTTDRAGTYELPIPERPSIVRARPLYLDGPRRSYQTIGTHNALLDPGELPPAIELVARRPSGVRFETVHPWGEGHHLTVEDGTLDLVIERVERLSKSVDLVPGRYVARHWEHDVEIGAVAVVVGDEDLTLVVP